MIQGITMEYPKEGLEPQRLLFSADDKSENVHKEEEIPEADKNQLSLSPEQFCKAKNMRNHKSAGFISDAKKNYPNRKFTMNQWNVLHKQYLRRPV